MSRYLHAISMMAFPLHLDYIVLENLTARYRFPCILDLKVGTRQHGDDATEEKKIRHTKICTDSTSLSLGVRLCGAQVCVCVCVYICVYKCVCGCMYICVYKCVFVCKCVFTHVYVCMCVV